MTLDTGQNVRLSRRDWFAICGLAFAIFSASMASYLRIDRTLAALEMGQTYQAERIASIERDIARLESRIMEASP